MSGAGYRWRRLDPEARRELLAWRKAHGRPWHSPPHRPNRDGDRQFLLTASCFDHRAHIGRTLARMDAFSAALVATLTGGDQRVIAWCVLPNHYHALIDTPDVLGALDALGRLHGRTSHAWNGEDRARGRRVFFRAVERRMRSERHAWATMNYVHHNPLRHRYASRWTDWPWSSAAEFIESVGREEAARVWRTYPIDRYGDGWDDADL